jgi:hypothetical protein
MPGSGDAIERGKGRAERERERELAKFEKAMQNAVYGGWDKCIVKWLDETDGTIYWDDYTCKL